MFTARAGGLLRGTFGSAGAVWQPYLKGNVWWGSHGSDTVTFGIDPVQTGRQGGTAVEGGGGITGKLTQYVSVYGDASYLTAVSGGTRNAVKGNVACAYRGKARLDRVVSPINGRRIFCATTRLICSSSSSNRSDPNIFLIVSGRLVC